MTERETMIRPWNMRPGDRFILREETSVPARTITREVTGHPYAERGHFTRHKQWIIPSRTVETSDLLPDLWDTETTTYYSDERVARISRGKETQ